MSIAFAVPARIKQNDSHENRFQPAGIPLIVVRQGFQSLIDDIQLSKCL